MFQFLAVTRKRPLDGGSDEESEDLHVIVKRNSRRKARAFILETDSDEEGDSSVKTNCESGTREKVQSTELEVEMTDEEGYKAGEYCWLVYLL